MKSLMEIIEIGDELAETLETSIDYNIHEDTCAFVIDRDHECNCRVKKIAEILLRWQEAISS